MKEEKVKNILKQTQTIYNAIAPDFSNTRGKWWQGFGSFYKYVKPGDRVLDLGCGNGRMADIFNDSKIQYLGIDNSKELIEIARKRFQDKDWVKFEVGDISSVIPGLTRNPDLVLIIAVMHHIPTKKLKLKVLKNIYDLLKPGGRLVMSNWNLWQTVGENKKFRYWKWLLNYRQKIKKGIWSLSDALVPWKPLTNDNLRYVHSFKKREMKKMLRQVGFEIESNEFETKTGEITNIWKGSNLLTIAIKK